MAIFGIKRKKREWEPKLTGTKDFGGGYKLSYIEGWKQKRKVDEPSRAERAKQTRETLKTRKKIAELERKTAVERKQEEFYAAKARKQAAKKSSSWFSPSSNIGFGVKKRRQGKKLSQKRRIVWI